MRLGKSSQKGLKNELSKKVHYFCNVVKYELTFRDISGSFFIIIASVVQRQNVSFFKVERWVRFPSLAPCCNLQHDTGSDQ